MAIFLTIVLWFLVSQEALSCNCLPLGEIDDIQYDQYQVIIKGKILKIFYDAHGKEYLIKIERNYKGVDSVSTVGISRPTTDGICGIDGMVGEYWLFFAYKDGKRLSTNLCTRTKTLEVKAWDYRKHDVENDLKFLEQRVKEQKEQEQSVHAQKFIDTAGYYIGFRCCFNDSAI